MTTTPTRVLICQNCSAAFRYPVNRWRSDCFTCGGDDKVNWGPLIEFVALVDFALIALLALAFHYRLP